MNADRETTLRPTAAVIPATAASDGAGVRLHRSLGGPRIPVLDPFLLLDEMHSDDASDYVAGFPNHPHRGFETVTYMLAGHMRHEDSVGNSGDLGPGALQWMTAGRGIIHSEMPQQEDGLLWGFQMWINLPKSDKMRTPRYQDIPASSVPEVDAEGGAHVRVLAGAAHGVLGPVEGIVTAPLLLDVSLPAGATLVEPIPRGHNAFAYVFEGSARFGGSNDETARTAGVRDLVVFDDGDAVRVTAARSPARFLLAAARPIGEPIARYGPFVMTTRDELLQAFRDYEAGRLTA